MDRYFRVEGKLVFHYSCVIPAKNENNACFMAAEHAKGWFNMDDAEIEGEEVDYLGDFGSLEEAKQYGGR